MIDEIEEYRQSISRQASLVHERLWSLQVKIFDRRITHLMSLQGMAPEKSSLAGLTPKQLRGKLDEYQSELDDMKRKHGALKLV